MSGSGSGGAGGGGSGMWITFPQAGHLPFFPPLSSLTLPVFPHSHFQAMLIAIPFSSEST